MPAGRPSVLAVAALWTVSVYRNIFSNIYLPSCRFIPSCSSYATEAIRRYGTARGAWLACCRLFRCRPGGPRGVDLVP